jgi:Xaa-Pro dipeptidase
MRFIEAQCAFIPRNGSPYLFCASTPKEMEQRMPWLKGRVGPSFGLIKGVVETSDHPMVERLTDRIASLMAEHGVEKEPLGLDGTTLQMLYSGAFLKKGIKTAHGKLVMDRARTIKTVDELEIMRIAAQNTEVAFAAVADAIRPGVRECDLVGEAIRALYREGVDHTEDCVCMTGQNTNPIGITFTDRPVRPGDIVYMDVDGAAYQGYKTCVYRAFCCGKATREQKDLHEEAREMLYKGLSVIKDGVKNHEIMAQWPDSPAYWGYDPDDYGRFEPLALAHGIGLTLHDMPFVTRSTQEVEEEIKAGMVLAVETYAGQKGGYNGVRLEEMVIVKQDGCEVISKWPIDKIMECWL